MAAGVSGLLSKMGILQKLVPLRSFNIILFNNHNKTFIPNISSDYLICTISSVR